MQGFAPRITSIKGMSERRRLPRLGKIRLGVKVPNKGKDPGQCECKGTGCFKCTHPAETPYFVVPPEVAKIYGNKPTELDVMVPVEDNGVVFPQSYKWYGSSRGLKCQGNLEIAYRYDEEAKGIKEIDCPCDLKDEQCKPSSSLQVILYKVNFGGVYQISSGSMNSMIDVASGFDYARCLLGRVAMVPLKLRRVATETHHDGKKQIHYPLRVVLETNDPEFINALREQTTRILTAPQALLPPPDETRPDLDGPIITEWAEEGEQTIASAETIKQEPPPPAQDHASADAEIAEQDRKRAEKMNGKKSKDVPKQEFVICPDYGKHPAKQIAVIYCKNQCTINQCVLSKSHKRAPGTKEE